MPTPQTAFLAVALPGMGVELRELYLPVDPARFGGGNRSSVAAAQLSEAFWPLSYRLNSLAGLLLIASIWRAAFEKEGMDALLLMAFEKCVYSAIHNSGVRAGRLLERAESARAVKAQKRGNKKLPLPFTPLEVLERYEALPRREGFSDMDRYADVGESLMRDYPNVPQLPWKRVKALCTQARKDRKKLQQSS